MKKLNRIVLFFLIQADFYKKVALKGGRVGVWPSPQLIILNSLKDIFLLHCSLNLRGK
jgi:hypothetical protein